LSAFAVSISIGDKISVGHAQFTGSANLSSVAWVTGNAQATVTCSASVSSSAIAARIIPAEAHVSDSFEVTPGYWIPEVKEWQYQSGLEQGRTGPNGASSGSYVSGHWWTDNNGSNTSGETTDTWQLLVPYFGYIPPSAGGPVYRYSIAKYVVTTAAIWVPPVNTPSGYTPNAQVVVSDVSILSGSFAYPSASADVTASGTRLALVSADVTSEASAAAEVFTVRYIDASAAFNSEASATSSALIDFFGSAQITATAQSTANGANETFATGSFSGSSLAISVGHKIAVGQTAIACSASLSATSNVERFTSATINANADLDAVGNTTVVLAGQMTASASANITTAPSLQVYVAATVSASATATADGDTLISATASVSDSSYVIPGYWIPAYDTYVDSLAAAYWVNFTNSQIQISGVYISIAPYYANTTYNGTNIPTTILNTLNNAAAFAGGGISYYSQLTQARTRSGVSGFDGGFKQRVTTTHPAVYVPAVVVDGYWTVTGLGPTSNTTATAEVMHGALFSAAANVEGSIYLESTTTLNIEASTAITATDYVDVYVDGAFTGSNVTITAGEILIFASGAIEASATITAEADRSVIAKAFIEGNAVFTSQGVGLNVSEARVTASAATVDAEGVVLRYVAVPLNIDATVIITTRFVLLAQEGQRSNGILILVEPENRTLLIEVKKERVIYAKAA
jgi:hypothetical protein